MKYKGGYLLERHCAKLINKAISISRSQDHLYATPSYYSLEDVQRLKQRTCGAIY